MHDFFSIMGSNQLRHTSSQGADNSGCCSIRVSQDPILSILASKEDKNDERAAQVLERIFFDPKIKRCKLIEWETHYFLFKKQHRNLGKGYIYMCRMPLCVVWGGRGVSLSCT